MTNNNNLGALIIGLVLGLVLGGLVGYEYGKKVERDSCGIKIRIGSDR